MNFKDVIKINIPEGIVIKITDSNGVVIWKYFQLFPEIPNYPILPEPTASQIYYYSVNERVVPISSDYVISSTYEDGIGLVKFNTGLSSIPSYIFMDKPIMYARLPEGVNTISSGAFAGSSLKFIDIPDSVEYINTQAFAECDRLQTVILPKNIKTISNQAFYSCGNLSTIICQSEIAPTIRPFTGDINFATFEGVGSSLSSEIPKILYVPKGSTGYDEGEWKKQLLDKGWTLVYYRGEKPDYSDTPIFPDELKATFIYTTIDNNVIEFDSDYTGINYLSNSYSDGVGEMVFKDKNRISEMDRYIFYNCTTLQSMIIPDSVTSIGDYAFQNCTNLTSISIPKEVVRIGYQAFRNCSSLELIEIPISVVNIEGYAFAYCTGLTTIDLPSGLTLISNGVFSGCTGLTAIDIPENVTSIGDYAFSDCTGLTSIVIPENVTSIGDYSFYNCTGLTTIDLPSGLTLIGNNAFYNCTGLTTIDLPSGLTSIGNGVFNNCTGLTNIDIPENVTSIGNFGFSDCTGLTSIDIPENVTSIGNYGFSGCENLTTITCRAIIAPTLGTNVNEDTGINSDNDKIVYIPKTASTSSYFTGEWLNQFINNGWLLKYIGGESITSTLYYTSTDNKIITLPTSYTGIQPDTNTYKDSRGEMVFNVLLDIVGDKMFYSKSTLSSITIPNGVTSIGEECFYNCSSLTSVDLPDSLTSIGYNSFRQCSSLTSVDLPDSLTSIGKSSFFGCSSLSNIHLSKNLITINDYAFRDCRSLTSIDIPENVTSIGSNAFYNCKNIATITCRAMTAPTIYVDTFANAGTEVSEEQPKVLQIPQNATGYDSGNWKTYVIDKGYTLEYITE